MQTNYKPICTRKDEYGNCIYDTSVRRRRHSSVRYKPPPTPAPTPAPSPPPTPAPPPSGAPQKVKAMGRRLLSSQRPSLEIRPTHTLTHAESMKARLAETARINNMEGGAGAELYLKNRIHNGHFDNHRIRHDLSEKQAMAIETPDGMKVIIPGSEMPFSSKTSKLDWAHNAMAATGLEEYSAQTSAVRRVINNVHEATGSKPVELIGYSKGGQQALKNGREQGIEATAFNPHMTLKEMMAFKLAKWRGNIPQADSTILRTTHDPASGLLGWMGEGSDPKRKTLSIDALEEAKGKRPLTAHDLENFMNLEPNAPRFGGNARVDAFRKSLVQSKRLVEFEDHHNMLNSVAREHTFNQYLQDHHSDTARDGARHLNITPEKEARLKAVWKESGGREELTQEARQRQARMEREAAARQQEILRRAPKNRLKRLGRRRRADRIDVEETKTPNMAPAPKSEPSLGITTDTLRKGMSSLRPVAAGRDQQIFDTLQTKRAQFEAATDLMNRRGGGFGAKTGRESLAEFRKNLRIKQLANRKAASARQETKESVPRSADMEPGSLAHLMADHDAENHFEDVSLEDENTALLAHDAETAKNERIVDSKNFTTVKERRAQANRSPAEREAWIRENPLPAARRAAADHMKMATDAIKARTMGGRFQDKVADIWHGANPFSLGGAAGLGVGLATSGIADALGVDQNTKSGAAGVGVMGAVLQAPLSAAIAAGGLPAWGTMFSGLASEAPSAAVGSILAMKGASALDRWIRKHHPEWEKDNITKGFNMFGNKHFLGGLNFGSKAGYYDSTLAGGIGGGSMYATNLALRATASAAYKSLAGGARTVPMNEETTPLLEEGGEEMVEPGIELGGGESVEAAASGIEAASASSEAAAAAAGAAESLAPEAAAAAAGLSEAGAIAAGTEIGAEAGSFIPVPVVGTIIGAGVGAGVGAIGYLLGKLF